jgi:NAD(P)-dependent dehydrogenase (short-subunit alcohol dehydrogenase family)
VAVLAVDEARAELRAMAKCLARDGARVVPRAGRLDSPTAAADCVAEAVAAFDRLDLVVHCGPVPAARSIARMEPAEWSTVVEEHLRSLFFLTQAATRHMVAAGGGSRILMSAASPALHVAGFGQAHAAAAGGALCGLVRSAAAELLHKGIGVNGVLWSAPPDADGAVAAEVLAETLGTVEALLLFLASPAARAMSGQVVVVECGRVSLARIGQTAGAVSVGGRWSPEEVGERWSEISR